ASVRRLDRLAQCPQPDPRSQALLPLQGLRGGRVRRTRPIALLQAIAQQEEFAAVERRQRPRHPLVRTLVLAVLAPCLIASALEGGPRRRAQSGGQLLPAKATLPV